MPTYEYLCSKCGHQFDLFQPIADNAITSCTREACGQKRWGKGPVKRVIGAGAGLIFKGSGFYITDYRSDKYKEAAKKDTPAAPAAAASTSGSGETKSAPAKSESKPSSSGTPKKD